MTQGTTDLEEYTRLAKEADMRLTELHWYLWSPRTVHCSTSPWIRGCGTSSGEAA